MASEAAPARRSELRTRVASAAVLAPIAIAGEILGGPLFAAIVTLVACLALWEWIGITSRSEPIWLRAASMLALAAGLICLAFNLSDWSIGLIAIPTLLALAGGYWRRGLLWVGLGLAYAAVPGAALIVLRKAEPFGWAAVLFIFIVVWTTDSAAYFGGRRFGGPKLWERVSPKKTWSGALSGLLGAVVAGGGTAWLTGAAAFLTGALLAAPLSIASQAGDLLESAIKRRFGVKDSGHLIPGHGGVLDRMDGLFTAAALAWLIAGLGIGGQLLELPQDIVDLSGRPN